MRFVKCAVGWKVNQHAYRTAVFPRRISLVLSQTAENSDPRIGSPLLFAVCIFSSYAENDRVKHPFMSGNSSHAFKANVTCDPTTCLHDPLHLHFSFFVQFPPSFCTTRFSLVALYSFLPSSPVSFLLFYVNHLFSLSTSPHCLSKKSGPIFELSVLPFSLVLSSCAV